MKSGLYYRDEHLSCTHFYKDDTTFEFISTEKDNEYKDTFIKENLIILFLKGNFRISSHYFSDQSVSHNEMVVLPQGDSYRISTSQNACMLFFRFQAPTSSCAKQLLNSYKHITTSQVYDGFSLIIKDPIQKYVSLLDYYLSEGIKCEHLFEIKKDEFFLSLRWFYSKEDLSRFFYPVIHCTCSFRKAIMENMDSINSVADMIEICNMSKSSFYKRFKKEFGISAKQWLIAQLKERIRKKILEPEVTAKDLMNEFNFSSPEYLNLFCKKQFGMTPSKLIKSHQIVWFQTPLSELFLKYSWNNLDCL